MNSLPASVLRGLTVLAIGTTLTLSHIAFAAAAPQPMKIASVAPVSQSTGDVDSTSSISSDLDLAENCYIDTQVVKSVRGKRIMTRIQECD
jgi:hypothetical protein